MSPKKSTKTALPGNMSLNIRHWKRERPDLDLTTLLLVMCALRLAKVIEDEFERNCQRRFGLRANEMRVLLALRRSGPPYAKRPTDLFRSLLVTSGAITKQVNRLIRMKLVDRLPDPDHAGGSLIQLSRRGRVMVDKATEMLAGEGLVHAALQDMRPSERTAGLRFIEALLAHMDDPIASSRLRSVRPVAADS